MEDIKEIYYDSKDSVKQIIEIGAERLKNPLLGAFFISFVLYNWQSFLYLLFSSSTIEEKILGIKNDYFQIDGLLTPILIAIFYYMALPFLLAGSEYILSFTYKWRLGTLYKNKISEARKKGVLAFSQKRAQEIASGNIDRGNLLRQISNLEKTIEQLNETARSKEEVNINQMRNLNNLLQDMKNNMNFKNRPVFKSGNIGCDELANEFNCNEAKKFILLPEDEITFSFDQLPQNKIKSFLDLKLMEKTSDANYTFTKEGSEFRKYFNQNF